MLDTLKRNFSYLERNITIFTSESHIKIKELSEIYILKIKFLTEHS